MSNAKSTLTTLRNLNKKNQAVQLDALQTQLSDTAIAGSSRKATVVRLGIDPSIKDIASRVVSLKNELERSEKEFSEMENHIRSYGSVKRDAYNEAFKSDIKTVCIPYIATSENGETETHYVKVSCSDNFSIKHQEVLAHETVLGSSFSLMFEKSVERRLRPNSIDIVRELLRELGAKEKEVDSMMDTLFEQVTRLSVKSTYEEELKKLPDAMKQVLSQIVTKAKPSVKYED